MYSFKKAMTEQVILVDENDHVLGSEEKMKAHQLGKLHRAFSVFVFHRQTKKLLLQQRQFDKYHSGGLWTNTCCGHPRPEEPILSAATRRLSEEMGITVTLEAIGTFCYTAHFDNGLTENEYDHVFLGYTNSQLVSYNPQEIAAVRWVTHEDLTLELQSHPEKFTAWFAKALTICGHIP